MFISYSGCSVVDTDSGLPEGGMMGPLCYPLLPRVLDKRLAALRLGIGIDIPQQYWHMLMGHNALSACSVQSLSFLDSLASLRVHILLVADDQIMPASHLE